MNEVVNRKMPSTVISAIVLFWVSYVLGIIRAAIEIFSLTSVTERTIGGAITAVIFVVVIFLIVMFMLRRNWARIVLLILNFIAAISGVIGIITALIDGETSLVWGIVDTVVAVIMIILLLNSTSVQWFAKKKN